MSEPQPGTDQPSPGSTQPDEQQTDNLDPQVDHGPSELQDNVAFVLGRAPSPPPAPDFVPSGQPFVGGGKSSLGAASTGQPMPTAPLPSQLPDSVLASAVVSGTPEAAPAPGTSKKKGIIVGVLVGLVVLALLAAVFVIVPWLKNTAERAVQNYLVALSNSNADEALSYAKEKPADLTFLTNDHLKKSNETAAITDVTVEESGTRQPDTVTAHYKIGEESITASFGVTKIDDVWKINQVANSVLFESRWVGQGLTVLLNDQAITSTSVILFPGTYRVTTENKYVTVGDVVVNVKDPSALVDTTSMSASLTDEGASAVRQAAARKWESCLAEKVTFPVGCGYFVTSPDHPIKEGSLKWSQTKAPTPVEDASVSLSLDNPLQAVGAFNARVHGYADFADTTALYGYIDWDVTGFTADLSKEEVLVTFDFPTRVNT